MSVYPIAVFIDTNIFDESKYHLEGTSPLNILKKFSDNKKVSLYTSDIVLGEARRHIKENVLISYELLKKNNKEMRKHISPSLIKDTPFASFYEIPENNGFEEVALAKFNQYLEDLNFMIIDSSGVDVNQIIDDYFQFRPPFENNEKKKNEFPDAIMISKIKSYFSEIQPMWIISGDKGFRKAFENIDGFSCFDKLNEIFDLINEQDEKKTYDAIKTHLFDKNVVNNITSLLEEKISDGNFEIDGQDCDRKGICEGYDYDEAFIDAISGMELRLSSVNDVSDNNVTVTIECKADISVFCGYDDYSNSAWDSEEKEYLYIGRGQVSEDHSVEFDSTLTFEVSSIGNEFDFKLINIEFDLEMNQWTRTNREIIESDPRGDWEADMMDALEEYHKH
ncbi:PIN domain-containing protein [Sinanaerobacter sp. ZZT-01]|uniref:PIN domain-containing protein n=1 Tax=Sinanaerobacter sp. ZZT-01 TaxID=3111540 RepID=UPI002D767476|nr:PIN domain-containing protein [Sinanaerobacter sp. ZZT-01]WRR93855.1 PIN domain-containing protein [Sinanaerobacter sp. ZZT-01]